ncbi:MAG TPA: ParA family protein [Pseudonocardiaceae bacterium]|jgi:chromosome partitioning protein|nr:ParA family protein [Pseudonocardiaceae bacterium]
MARRYAFCNNKGGVGKSTEVTDTAAALAMRDRNVLVVDFDPQADASRRMGFEVNTDEDCDTIADVIREVHSSRGGAVKEGLAAKVIQQCRWQLPYAPRIHFIPSRFDLEDSAADTSSANSFFRLADALKGVDDQYDYCLIDLPPSLGPLAQMGWAACGDRQDGLIVVTQPTFPAIRGARRTVERVYARRSRLDVPDLDVVGAVINMTRNTRHHAQRIAEIRSLFGDRVWVEQPMRTAFSEQDDKSLPITALPPGYPDREALSRIPAIVADKLIERGEAA